MKRNIIVSGASSQIALALKSITSGEIEDLKLIFLDKQELNLTQRDSISAAIKKYKPLIFINSAAYTNVEKAELDILNALEVNYIGIRNLSENLKKYGIPLIHISSDYVFDGKINRPYTENDIVGPLNVYGASKLLSENVIKEVLDKYIILRTSWLISKGPKGFVSKISSKLLNTKTIEVIDDNFGGPTCIYDLIDILILIVKSISNNQRFKWGIYHFSNYPKSSWFDIAVEIKKVLKNKYPRRDLAEIRPVSSNEYKSNLIRPYSTFLDSSKILNEFQIKHNDWRNLLDEYIN